MKVQSIFLFVFLFNIHVNTFFTQVLFEDKASELGVNHSMINADYWGGGVSVFDFDGDGWDDITFASENDSVKVYRNNSGQFELMPFAFYSSGQVKSQLWVDYDNDGDNDFIMSTRNGKVKLYKQESFWQFSEVSLPLSLSEVDATNYGISFADYDLDGYLDLYICRYIYMSNPIENPSIVNILLRNQGDGTFADATYVAGVQNGVKPSFIGGWVDINHDLYPDLYVINDRNIANNAMYLNNGNGTFSDISESSGTLLPQDEPMSLTFEDFNNDGLLDIFCSNSGTGLKLPRLLVNQGDNTFLEQAQQLGITMNEWSWGATWVDVNNDSYLDLYISTGVISSSDGLDVRSYLYINNDGNDFEDSPESFVGNHVAPSFSVAKGDFDRDGFPDLVVQNTKEVNSYVWINQSELNGSNNFVNITLTGTESNRMAIGSWINLYTDGNRFVHYTRCGENYGSQNSQHHQFGLGSFNTIDSIIVEYPSGIIDKYFNLDVNSHYYFYESETFIFPIIHNGNLTTCDTSSVLLDGGDYVSYSWNNGHNERYLNPLETGYYWLQAQSSNGLIYRSDTVYVHLKSLPEYDYSISHSSCFASEDGAISLDFFESNFGATITWSNGFSGSQVTNLSSGLYTFEYSDSYNCSFSDTIEIIEPDELYFVTSPSHNEGLWELFIVVFGGYPPYLIRMNGEEIGLITSEIPSGEYLIQITDFLGCSTEQTLNLNISSIEENVFSQLLFPNPSKSGLFYLNINSETIDKINVVNERGQKVIFDYNGHEKAIKINQNNPGKYFLVLFLEGKRIVIPLIIE